MKIISLIIAFAFLTACGHGKHYKKRWEKMDADKDGKVSEKEYMSHKNKKFTEMDSDKDGFVTTEEKKAYKKQCKSKKKKQFRKKKLCRSFCQYSAIYADLKSLLQRYLSCLWPYVLIKRTAQLL